MTPSPLWKRVLILLICLWGVLAAMPNAPRASIPKSSPWRPTTRRRTPGWSAA